LQREVAGEGDTVVVGEPMTDRLHGLSGAVGGGPHVCDERLQRRVLHVVAVPPLIFVEEAGVDTAVQDHRRVQGERARVVFGLGVRRPLGTARSRRPSKRIGD
jgi:hypothetical protein